MSTIRETIARIIVEKTLILGGNGTADAIIVALSTPDDAMVERGARGLCAYKVRPCPGKACGECANRARACLTEAFRAAREGE